MAKDKKDTKKKKAKLPKQIGGVKVPKELRGAGGKALKLAKDHPVLGEAVAAGLLAAAAALMEKDEAKRGAGKVLKAAAGAMGVRLMDEAKDAFSGKGRKAKAEGETAGASAPAAKPKPA
jgi:hypothetical protein